MGKSCFLLTRQIEIQRKRLIGIASLAAIIFGPFACLMPNHCNAQDIEGFEPLKAKAPIPAIVTGLGEKKIERDLEAFEKANGSVSYEEEMFFKRQNYAVKELFHSGHILFNDTLSNYVQSVADHLYEQNRSAFEERPEIYLVKSPVASAFVFHFNKIFVNVGLLAQLSNEAELAYVIAHELVHYKEGHALARYKERKEILRGSEAYEDVNNNYEAAVATNLYSKVREREADVEGLKYYNNTSYQEASVFGAFNVLKYASFPFDNVPFERSFFETENLKFPDKLFLEKPDVIEAGKEIENEALRTHPNVQKRKRSIEKELGTKGLKEGSEFIVSEKAFNHVRDLARFEVCHLYLKQRDYPKAIYCAYLLQQDYPEHQYLKEVINKALYNLTFYKNNDEADEVLTDYEDIKGQSQQVYHFLHQLTPEELNILATQYAWKLKQEYPDNEVYDEKARNLLKALVFTHDLSKGNFYEASREKVLRKKRKAFQAKDELSKYEKIEKEQLENNINFKKFAFVELFEDEEFTRLFNKALKQYEKEELAISTDIAYQQLENFAQEDKKEKAPPDKPISRLTTMQPIYNVYPTKKQEDRDWIKSEKRERWFAQMQEETGAMNDVQMRTLNPYDFNENEVERYNRMAIVKSWHNEMRSHEDIDGIMISNQDRINKMIEETGSKHYLWSGVASKKRDGNSELLEFLVWGVSIFGTPVGLYKWIKPEFESKYLVFILDLKEGQVEWFESRNFQEGDRKAILQSFSYNTFLNINHKK